MIVLKEYRDNWLSEKFDEFIGFFPREFYCLDNFTAYKVMYRGVLYDTVEHAYQAIKFLETAPEIANKIKNCYSPNEAQQIAKQYKNKRVENWNEIKVNIMEELLRSKVELNPYVLDMLLKTENYNLCEDSPFDDFWGIGKNRDGQNQMGKLWMKIRKELQNKS